MKFDQYQIQRLLIELNIKFNSNKIRNNWMAVLCPSHADRNFGNASINLNSGVISCLACNQNVSIIKLYMQFKNISYKQAIEEIFNSTNFVIQNNSIPIKRKKQSYIKVVLDDFYTLKFNPEDYYYTKVRGYTLDFCKKFDIKRCIGGQFDDYFLIPIIDSKKNIRILEARKLMQREYIYKFLKISEEKFNNNVDNISPEKYFKTLCETKGWRINKNYEVINKDNKIINDFNLLYLLKPKTLYSKNVDIDFTIWNADNLDRNKKLWLTEGLGSIPKIYQYISKNCTSVFGTKITDDQLLYLKQFKNIIIIPDNDQASFLMILYLNKHLENVNIYVANIQSEDTDETFVQDINTCKILKANEYFLKYFNKYL